MRILLVLLLVALASCALPDLPGRKLATVPNQPRERSVDPATAVSLINAHRADRGRPQLAHDPRLSRIARQTARELARRDQLRTEMHTAKGLSARLEEANYRVVRSAENLGSGYPTLVTAIDGWKGSRRHNRNLLNRDMTHAGIGLALTDEGIFNSYWVLILVERDEKGDEA